jgi:hypothetical protein
LECVLIFTFKYCRALKALYLLVPKGWEKGMLIKE